MNPPKLTPFRKHFYKDGKPNLCKGFLYKNINLRSLGTLFFVAIIPIMIITLIITL